jgi:DNA-directed RNA polymerase subunit RPC12/RpoP
MIVRCSQCGARINRRDENRFFRCPFCDSSLVLEKGRSFARFIMIHERNDVWARAVFHERLVNAGVANDPGTIAVTLTFVPFWVIQRRNGSVAAHAAVEGAPADISSVKVPPGELIFFEEGSHPGAPVPAPTVPLGAVLGTEKEEDVGRIDLIYLPVYFMRAAGAGGEQSCALVADSSRLYPQAAPIHRQVRYTRSLLFFIGAAAFFTAAGIMIDDLYVRIAAIGVGSLALILIAPLLIGRTQQVP